MLLLRERKEEVSFGQAWEQHITAADRSTLFFVTPIPLVSEALSWADMEDKVAHVTQT